MPSYKNVAYTLHQRGKSWQYNVSLGGKRIRQQCNTEEAARSAVEAAIDRVSLGETPKPPTPAAFAKPTLQRVYEMLRDGKWKGTKGEASARKNAEDCIAVLGGDTPIDEITTSAIDSLIVDLKDRELAPGTVRRKLAALSTVVRFACRRHWIDTIPVFDRSACGKERRRLRWLSQDEERDGLKYLREYSSHVPGMGGRMADFFAFLIDTGLRLSEGVNLKWSEVDMDGTTGVAKSIRLGFDNKTEQPRLVPCTLRVVGILQARKAERVASERRVWPGLTRRQADHFWNQMRDALKLKDDKDFVIHACRHTFASRLAMAETPLNVIKELGGWKSLEMVLRYAHLSPAASTNAIARMQALTQAAG